MAAILVGAACSADAVVLRPERGGGTETRNLADPCRCPFTAFFNVKGGGPISVYPKDRSDNTRTGYVGNGGGLCLTRA